MILFKCVYNDDFPGICKKMNSPVQPFLKIYNFGCTNFYKKNQPKNTTNGVFTDSSTNAILEK